MFSAALRRSLRSRCFCMRLARLEKLI
jgi:hypothetical protein